MSTSVDPFAASYAEARAKFLDAAAGLPLQSHPEPLRGLELETLAMDVVRLGADDADRVLILSSGCHGVEGYCGSGAQGALLRDDAFKAHARDAGVALVFIHALNPWGFSYGRRVTHEGVDLNRNFIDFRRPPPRNAGYDELASLLLPANWPPSGGNELQLMSYAAAHGMAALQEAVSGGQYEHPHGVFFGGHGPTWSQVTLRLVLRQHAVACDRLGWIDLHSGLGESGVGERIYAGRDDPAAQARAKAWWGQRRWRSAARPTTPASRWNSAPSPWPPSSRRCASTTGWRAGAIRTIRAWKKPAPRCAARSSPTRRRGSRPCSRRRARWRCRRSTGCAGGSAAPR
jgi:hypothetical protein